MKKIVIKFGGSNLKTKEDVTRIIRVISHYQTEVVIVVSALYGVTDILTKTIEDVPRAQEAVGHIKTSLMEMHRRIVTWYIDDRDYNKSVIKKIKERIDKLEHYLLGVHYLGETPDFVRDVVLSYGERLSSLLLTAILNYKGIACEEVLPEQLGLLTNGEYGNAVVDFAAAEKNLQEHLSAPKRFIVPGFYGISPGSRVTLLGRGGSDYSAAAIGRCIDAASVDLWKDVDGFMSADPRIVDKAVSIKSLTYREAAELSYFGAQILHPRTFGPLLDKQIPLRLFNIERVAPAAKPTPPLRGTPPLEGTSREHSERATSTFPSWEGERPQITVGDWGVRDQKERSSVDGTRSGRGGLESSQENKIFTLSNIDDFFGNRTPLTVIDNKLVIKEDVVKSVTFSDDFGILKLTGPGVGMKPGIMARVTTRLHEGSINIKSIITAQTCINILLAREDLPKSCKMIEEMEFSTIVKVTCVDDISLIAVVGEGMPDRPGIASRVFGAVSREKVNILIISAGASSVATYFIIDRKHRKKTIRSIHKEFFA